MKILKALSLKRKKLDTKSLLLPEWAPKLFSIQNSKEGITVYTPDGEERARFKWKDIRKKPPNMQKEAWDRFWAEILGKVKP